MVKEVAIDDKLEFCEDIFLDNNSDVNLIIKLKDKNNKILLESSSIKTVLDKKVSYKFTILDLATNNNIDTLLIKNMTLGIDINNDCIIEKNKETNIKVINYTPIIVIDPGHGDIFNKYLDPGAVSKNGKMEKDLALVISKLLNNKLNTSKNIISFLTREKDLDDKKRPRIVWRTNIVKEKNADIIISIHLNASSNSSAKGYSILTQKGSTNKNSIKLAKNISDKYNLLNNRGIKSERNLGILRRSESLGTNKAAILIELGFISNDGDRKIIIEEATKISDNIFEGILIYIKENYEKFKK
jgi:N-acetylmuramoyl-L-alanine amidase